MSSSNDILDGVAHRIQAHASSKQDGAFAIDPLTIIAIVNCLIGIVRFIYQCRKDRAAISKQMRKPSLFYRLIIKRGINREWKDKRQRKVMYDSMLEVGASLSEKEITEIIKEVENLK